MTIGTVALYIGTIHTEAVKRPINPVRERLNFESEESSGERTRSGH
jgi:hypothetical protein